MPTIDIAFPIQAVHPIPADHGYLLYSAVKRTAPEVHERGDYGIHPIRGQQLGGRTLRLCPWSRLVIRTTTEHVDAAIQLSGKPLKLLDRVLRVGVPQVRMLEPAPALRSRLVTIKLKEAGEEDAALNGDRFTEAACKQLEQLGIGAETLLTLGKRRTLRVKDKEVVGYEVILEGLTAEESLNLQETGLGGRRHMGCGIFSSVGARKQRSRNV